MHSGALSTIACHCASAHRTLSLLAMTTALIDFILHLNWAGSRNELLLFIDKLKLQGVTSCIDIIGADAEWFEAIPDLTEMERVFISCAVQVGVHSVT